MGLKKDEAMNKLAKGEKYKTNEHQAKGRCELCGKVNHTSIWKVFVQFGWFRGDDIYIGKVCKICKAHKKNEMKEWIERKLSFLNTQRT